MPAVAHAPEPTFRTFESDGANEFAMRLAQAVAALDGNYSPVVFYGEPGAGKTHLLNAIAADLRSRHPDISFLYLSDRMPADFILSAPNGSDMPDQGYMYRPYADQQILLVDDLERFADSKGLRTRFEALFDAFFNSNRVVVVACNVEPHDLSGFDKRFLSRLNSGVAAEVGLPAGETRVRILKLEAERLGFPVETKTLGLLAELTVTTVGQLVELFQQVRLYCVATGQAPAAATVQPLVDQIRERGFGGEGLAAEQWCAHWFAQQVEALRAKHARELAKAKKTLLSVQENLEAEAGNKDAVRTKLAAATDALQQRSVEAEQLRAENAELRAKLEGEGPRLQELLQDKDDRIREIEAAAQSDLQQYQQRLAEVTSAAQAAQQAAREEAAQKDDLHAREVGDLEKRLEEIYQSLNDAQQDFAIRNQNKDKLLEKLSADYQRAKDTAEHRKKELDRERARLAEIEAELVRAKEEREANESELVQQLEERVRALTSDAEAARTEAAKRIAELEHAHTQALATTQDEARMALEDLRRQVEAKEGALRAITTDFQDKLSEVERERKSAAQAQQQAESAVETINALNTRIAEIDSALAAERDKAGGAEQQLAQASAELTQLRGALETRERELDDLRQQHAASAEAQAQAREATAQLETQLVEARKRAADRDALAEAVSLERTRRREMEEQLHTLEEQLQGLRGQHEHEREQAESARRELLEQLQATEAKAIQHEQAAARSAEQLRANEGALKKAKEAVAKFEREVAEKAVIFAKKERALEQTLHDRDGQIAQLRDVAEKLKANLEARVALGKKQEAAIGALQEQVAQKEARIAQVQEGDSQALKKMKAELRERETELTSLREEVQRLTREHEAEAERAAGELRNVEEAAAAAVRDRNAAVNQQQDLELELTHTREARARIEAERDEERQALELRIRELQEHLAEHERTQEARTAEQQEAVTRWRGEAEANASALAERDQELAELRERLETLERELQAVIEARNQAEQRLQDVRRGEADATAHVDEQLSTVRAEYEATIAALQEQLAAISGTQETATTALQHERDALASQMREMQQALETARAELSTQAKRHRAELAHAKAEAADTSDIQARLIDLETQVSARDRALQTLQDSFASQLAESSAKAREREAGLSNTLRDLQSQLNQMQMAADDRTSETEGLRTELEHLRKELERARRQAEEAEERRRAAEAELQGSGRALPRPSTAPPRERGTAPPARQAEPAAGLPTPAPRAAPPLQMLPVPAAGPLNPTWTFDTFESTQANAFSLRSAQQVAETPGELYNPLVVYGVSNAGKTHILHAIGNSIAGAHAGTEIVYTEVSALMAAIAGVGADADLDGVGLDADVLLLDHFQIEDLGTDGQLRLTRVLTNFVQDGRQLVLTSQLPPVKMQGIERELTRFLEGGLLLKFEPHPDVLQRQIDAMASAVEEAAPDAGEDSAEDSAGELRDESKPSERVSAAPPPAPTDSFGDLLAPDPELVRRQYRGPKVFDEFLDAYQEPNQGRRNRFPLYVLDEDQAKRHHFFHALANELQGLFPGATVLLLSCAGLAEAMRVNSRFDVTGLLDRLRAGHIVLINDVEAVGGRPAEVARAVELILTTLLGEQKLLTIGTARADKRDRLMGPIVKAGTRKKI